LKKLFLFFISTVLLGVHLNAQCNLTFSGNITDADTKANLPAATIKIAALNLTTQTNAAGNFILKGLCPGHYDVEISHASCQTIFTHIHIKNDFATTYVMPHEKTVLDSVTVTTTKKGYTCILTGNTIQNLISGQTVGEALTQINGVTALQTGNNIYKPVINGLHSARVLMLNNGIRHEGQQWGGEHAPEIDTYIANEITLVKGAQTLRYGGDAVGGVILIEPKLLSTKEKLNGSLSAALFSNNGMGVLSGVLNGAAKPNSNFKWRVQGTIKRGGNARTPNYWLDNSGLAEANLSAVGGWRTKKYYTELFYSLFTTKLAIFSGSHIGNVTDLLNAINSKQPPENIRNVGFSYNIQRPYQAVYHHLLKNKTVFNISNSGKLNIISALQYNNRMEYDKKRFASSSNEPQLDLELFTATTDVIVDFYKWRNNKSTIGINGTYQKNNYTKRLFIPNYEAVNFAAFLIEKWTINKLAIEAGIRYDYRNFYNTTTNDSLRFLNRNYSALTYNGGLQYQINKNLGISINLSSAWRAPNVNELYADGLHHGAARIEKGNTNLLPERANGLSLDVNYENNDFTFEISAHSKWINNFIYLQPSYPPQLTIRGAFPVFAFAQTNAWLYGINVQGTKAITHHFTVQQKVSILYAKNTTLNNWLIQMPANKYVTELAYNFNNGKKLQQSNIAFNITHVAQQKRIPNTGNIELTNANGDKYFAADYILPPNAYTTLNVNFTTSHKMGKKQAESALVINNLLNTTYREYMNAFRYFTDEVGINIAIKTKINF
jgi:iron complex outermembrane recepter protein